MHLFYRLIKHFPGTKQPLHVFYTGAVGKAEPEGPPSTGMGLVGSSACPVLNRGRTSGRKIYTTPKYLLSNYSLVLNSLYMYLKQVKFDKRSQKDAVAALNGYWTGGNLDRARAQTGLYKWL